MAAANASARGQRAAILASRLHELTGFYLSVDCLAAGCRGERSFAVADLASFYGRDYTVGQVLRRMRCSGGCGVMLPQLLRQQLLRKQWLAIAV